MAQEGPRIAKISPEEFRDFAKRHANSPEIGPIKTSLDGGVDNEDGHDRVIVGLVGCETLCATACIHLHQSVHESDGQVLKLDSVIVDDRLRRRGLAGLLVAQSFIDLVLERGRRVASIYAHSVHPGTLRLLSRLGFNDPHANGAPISNINFENGDHDDFVKACNKQVQEQLVQMKRQCALCRVGDRRTRPWCLPRGEKPKHR